MARPKGSRNKKEIKGPLTNTGAALVELTKGFIYSRSETVNADNIKGKSSALAALKAYKEELQKLRNEVTNNSNAATFLLESWEKQED